MKTLLIQHKVTSYAVLILLWYISDEELKVSIWLFIRKKVACIQKIMTTTVHEYFTYSNKACK